MPPGLDEGGFVVAIALDVPLQLRSPVSAVCSRFRPVLRAAVPIAAVNEHREPRPCEEDVSAREVATRARVLAKAEPGPVQYRPHGDFGPRIRRPVALHNRPDA